MLMRAIVFVGLFAAAVSAVCAAQLARAHGAAVEIHRIRAFHAAEAAAATAIAAAGGPDGAVAGALGTASFSATVRRDARGAVEIVATGASGGVESVVVVRGELRDGRFLRASWQAGPPRRVDRGRRFVAP